MIKYENIKPYKRKNKFTIISHFFSYIHKWRLLLYLIEILEQTKQQKIVQKKNIFNKAV